MAAINTFNRIVYFGDSLTDSGAVFDISDDFLTIPAPPEALGYAQQFSDGEVYADVAARLLGAPVENFAVGGARAVGVIPAAIFVPDEASFPDGFNGFTAPPPLSDLLAFDINVSGQVDRFVAQSSFVPGTAASILIGLNDLNNFTPTSADPDIVVQQALGLSGQILFETVSAGFQLAGAGVQTIVFNTLPGVTFTPSTAFASPDVIALGESIIPLYNFNLGLSAQVLQGAGIDARIVDLNYIAAEVEADASGYGFVAGFDESIFLGFGSDFVVVPDGQGGFAPFLPSNQTTQGVDNDQIAFIDLLHPTTAFHGILGYFQWASLTNEVTLNTLDGTADDTIGTTGNDVFFTSGGNDKIAARQGNDDLIGGLGDDFLIGNDGDDVLSGGTGIDRLIGGNNNDVLGGGD
ncbi:MAG: SGNH/GDSL hydrolase family protein, partial [Pseudomonadota bacterium]